MRRLFCTLALLLGLAGAAQAQVVVSITNAGTTGTTNGSLAKLTGAPSTAVIATTSDVNGIVGIVVSGGGTTGSALIARSGQVNCTFDGATTAGDWVIASVTTGGDCHDTGSATYPTTTGTQVLGRVLTTNGSGGLYAMTIAAADDQISGGGSGATYAPAMIANRWTALSGTMAAAGTVGGGIVNNTTAYCAPGIAQGTFTIQALGAYIQTAGSTNIQLAIYNNGAASGRPSTLVAATGNIADTGTGVVSGTITHSQLTVGNVYWLCVQANDGAVAFRVVSNGNLSGTLILTGSATLGGALFPIVTGVSTPSTFGTWPSLVGATWTDDALQTTPYIVIQVFSVP